MPYTCVCLRALSQAVRLAAWNALNCITKSMPKEELPQFIKTCRDGLQRLMEMGRRRDGTPRHEAWTLRGLSVPKGLTPFMAILQEGLIKGGTARRASGRATQGTPPRPRHRRSSSSSSSTAPPPADTTLHDCTHRSVVAAAQL